MNRIGEGKLGELWRGADVVPTKQVVIRIVEPHILVSEEALEAFTDDARLVRALSHPSIARILDVGATDTGVPFLVSEVLLGETLEELLERRGSLPPGGALHLVAAIAEAVAEAHRLGVVHLGIEPRAILLHREPSGQITAKLRDFGRARLLAPKRQGRGELEGTLAYQSPEQIADDTRTGASSDIWALGVLLFRCVKGHLPFDGRTVMAHHTLALSAQRIVKDVRGLDEGLRELILECLRYGRTDRLSASALAERARLLAWKKVGGWSDVEKMVRLPDDVCNPEMFGAIDHLPTIPGMLPLVTPRAVAKEAPVAVPVHAAPRDEAESDDGWTDDATSDHGWSIPAPVAQLPEPAPQPKMVAAPQVIVPPPLPVTQRILLPVPIALPMPVERPRVPDTLRPFSAEAAAMAMMPAVRPSFGTVRPSLGTDLRALRPRTSRVMVGAVGSIVAFCIGAIVATTEQPTRAPRRHAAGAVAAAVAAEVSKPGPRAKLAGAGISAPAAGVVNAIATIAKASEPKPAPEPATQPVAQSAPTKTTAAKPIAAKSKKSEHKTETTHIANMQGVPLWDGPPPKPKPATKKVDDNPYD